MAHLWEASSHVPGPYKAKGTNLKKVALRLSLPSALLCGGKGHSCGIAIFLHTLGYGYRESILGGRDGKIVGLFSLHLQALFEHAAVSQDEMQDGTTDSAESDEPEWSRDIPVPQASVQC